MHKPEPEQLVVTRTCSGGRVVCRAAGRRLLVEFTCGRCGITEFVEYKENPACSAHANIVSHDVPDGWLEAGTYVPLLCPRCIEAFERFLGK